MQVILAILSAIIRTVTLMPPGAYVMVSQQVNLK